MSVAMIDVRDDALGRGMQPIQQDWARRVKKGRIAEDESRGVIGRVQTATSVEGCSGAPLVVEAVIEDAEVKKQVFADLGGVVGEEAVLATNTSSLSVAYRCSQRNDEAEGPGA
jgi:3-hydroxybutyryl-CoA dehydrogenase